MSANLVAQRIPVHGLRAIHVQVFFVTTFAGEHLDRVDWQNTLTPERAFIAGVAATFNGQLAGRLNREIAHGFHGAVRKLNGLRRGVGNFLHVQRILEAHDAEAHRTVFQVRVTRRRHRVVVDVDNVIEHPYCGIDGALQFDQIKTVFIDVLGQVD